MERIFARTKQIMADSIKDSTVDNVLHRKFSRRDALKVGLSAILATTMAACGPTFNSEPTDAQTPSPTTEPISTGTPFPEGGYVNSGKASFEAEKDPSVITKEIESFEQSRIDWYDDKGNLQTSANGKDSGFVLLGVLNAQPSDVIDSTIYTKFGYITSAGGKEHLAQKITDERWVVLSPKQISEPNGNVLNSFGYPSHSIFYPILSVEYTQDGKPTGDEWFFDMSVNRFYKIEDLEQNGKSGMMAVAQVGNEQILTGQALMKGNKDEKWNFLWQEDGSLAIAGGDSAVLYTYNEKDSKWEEPAPVFEFTENPDIENYKDQVINYKDLFNGKYKKWLESLPPTVFDPNNINDVALIDAAEGEVSYYAGTAPNFTGNNKDRKPFNMDRTFAYCTYEGNEYIIMPIEYFDSAHPDKNQWLQTAYNITGLSDAEVQERIKVWRTQNAPLWYANDNPYYNGKSNVEDPLVSFSFEVNLNMTELIHKFVDGYSPATHHQGDRAALDLPGIVVHGFFPRKDTKIWKALK